MKNFVLEILKKKPKNEKDLMRLKRILAKKEGRKLIRNSEIWAEYKKLLAAEKIKPDFVLERLLRKRSIRTMSGIAPVAVLTKPYPCPGKCAYCPTEKNVPKSYLSNEPAVMRAIRNKFDPYNQVRSRLEALEANGHRPEKIELIVIGGTWSYLPRAYKYWFIANCFAAANQFQLQIKNYELQINKNKSLNDLKKILAREQKKNEKAKYKIIGITLETRPDYINEKELIEMRELGATRVELGVQAVDDKILALNKRGHDVAQIARATALLRAFGFKITYHLMPGLPGAAAKKDLAMFKKLFSDERFQPDQIKFYPTVVTKGSLLYRWWKTGKYRPYSNKTLEKLIVGCKKIIPSYVRIIRLIRDIPAESIVAGNIITNLRQVMQQRGVECRCIRCRECREEKISGKNLKLNVIKYPAAGGQEHFISFDSRDGKILYGFCRLRLPCHPESRNFGMKDLVLPLGVNNILKQKKMFFLQEGSDPSRGASHSAIAARDRQDDKRGGKKIIDSKFSFLNNSALVRELHVYGELVPVGGSKKTQHVGLGKRLLKEAEKIASRNGFKKMAIISGVGVRGYYKKLGYKLKNGYVAKDLK